MDKSTISKFGFTSQAFHTVMKENVDMLIPPIRNSIFQNSVDKLTILHGVIRDEDLKAVDSHNKNLLFYAVYYESLACLLYLLRRGIERDGVDDQGRSVVHVCAYMGHVDSLNLLRIQHKLRLLQKLNDNLQASLTKYGFKRTDICNGKLKIHVSEQRRRKFDQFQQTISNRYRQFMEDFTTESIQMYGKCDGKYSQNSFHLSSLNKYQRCAIIIEFMFADFKLSSLKLQPLTLQLFTEVNALLKESQKIDPRLYESILEVIEDMMLPNQLAKLHDKIDSNIKNAIQNILSAKDKNGMTPVLIASQKGSTSIVRIVSKYGLSQTQDQKQSLIRLATNNLVRSQIMDLCQASKCSDTSSINFLISCGEEINQKKTIFGKFALLQAARSYVKEQNIQPLRILLKSGANVNQQDTNGWTVMHHAANLGLKQIIRELLIFAADESHEKLLINKMTNKGYHCLHLAAMNNHSQIIEMLLTDSTAKKLEIDPMAVDSQGCTMLHHAARKGSLESLRLILKHYPDVIRRVDVRSNTALHYAAAKSHSPSDSHSQCIKYLLLFNSDYNDLQGMRNSKGKLASDLVTIKKPFESIFSASLAGDVNMVRLLITQKPERKERKTPIKLRTVLMIAVIHRHLLIVKYLVDIGIDREQRDSFGKTALDYAYEMEKTLKNKQDISVMKNIISMLTNKQEPNQIKQSTLSVGKSQQKIDSKEPQLITSQIPSKSDFNEQKLSKNKTFGTYH